MPLQSYVHLRGHKPRCTQGSSCGTVTLIIPLANPIFCKKCKCFAIFSFALPSNSFCLNRTTFCRNDSKYCEQQETHLQANTKLGRGVVEFFSFANGCVCEWSSTLNRNTLILYTEAPKHLCVYISWWCVNDMSERAHEIFSEVSLTLFRSGFKP